MKKTISILLVFVLLISSLCPTSVFAAMENTNLDWTNTTNWIFNDGSSKNIGTNAGAVAYTGGNGITVDSTTFADRGTTLKLDSGSFYASLPLNTEPNTDYRLTFSYYSTAVANNNSVNNTNYAYAFNSAGIFIPNHPAFAGVDGTRLDFAYTMTYLVNYASNYQMYTPAGRNWGYDSNIGKYVNVDQNGDGNPEDGRKYEILPNFHNIQVNTWYTLSYNFNSSDFEDIAFTFQKVAGGEMWIDDIVLEKNIEDNDDYFEDNDKWIMSLRGSQDARKNIATDRTTGTYSSGWATGTTEIYTAESASGDGRCIKTGWPSHAYNIPLSGLEKNSTYSIEFYYKVLTGVDTDAAFDAMGVYSPKFMNDKLTAEGADISNLKFDNYTVGWAAVDRVINGKYCRYRDDTLEKGAVTANRYFEDTDGDYTYAGIQGRWIKEKIEFSVKDYNDLHLVIIPGTTNGILLDDFRLVKLDNAFDNPDAWSAIKNDNTVDTSLQPTVKRLTKNGSIVKTLEMSGSAGVYATKVTTKQNHYYSFSFDYYGTELGNVNNTPYWAIIESCGVAELNDDGKLIRRDAFTDDPARIYTTYLSLSFEGNTIGKRLPSQVTLQEIDAATGNVTKNDVRDDHWYTISFEFSSGNNDALEFYIDPLTPTTFNVANFQLEDLGAYTSADTLEENKNQNKNLYNSCGSIKYEEVDATNKDTTKGFRLPYIGSGIEFKVSGTDNVKAGFKLPAMSSFKDYSVTEIGKNNYVTKYHTLRMKVWVDGKAEDDVIINGKYETTKWFTVAKGLNSNEEHTIKLVRATEAALGDKLILMGVLSGDGNLVDVAKTAKPYIEVYGDSISSGYGNIASGVYPNFNNDTSLYSYVKDNAKVEEGTEGATKNLNVSEYDFEDGTKTYAYLAAQNLGADINVFSKSGLGITVYGRKAGEGVKTMAKWYPELQKNENADYVIINHITNDSGPREEGISDPSKDDLADAYVEFIQKVRNDHKNAKIIVIYGMMNSYSIATNEDRYKTGGEAVLQAVSTAKQQGDSNVYALMLPKGGNGGAGHPDKQEHIDASKLLTEFINGLGVIKTENSAGIRAASTDKGQGIRVKNNISKAEIAGKNIVSYGAIAIRKYRMTVGAPLTFATKDIAIGVAYNTDSSKFNGVVEPAILREETKDDNIFSCVLINIPQRYYGDKYSVRSFAIDKEGNVYYGEVVEVSVFDVVRTILDPDTDASQNDKNTANNIVKEIIEAHNKNDKIPTYAQWCVQNSFDDYSDAANNNQ